ncbi:MAG: MFS transporter [Pseudonocardia sp.]
MSETRARSRPALVVVAVCFLTIVFDGYDLIVYGSVVPSLLAEPGWGIGPAQAGAIGSYALVGMLIGALGAGAVTDRIGRRRIVLVGIAWFSVAMGLCALATSPELLGLFRFLAGLGLGGVLPSAITLTVEYAPRGRRQLYRPRRSPRGTGCGWRSRGSPSARARARCSPRATAPPPCCSGRRASAGCCSCTG